MTLGEFYDYEYGYEFRKAEELNVARHIMWSNLAAMGGKDTKQPNEIMPLWIDKIGIDIEKSKEKEYLSDEIVKKWINSLE